MYINDKILVGKSAEGKELAILPNMANRHGLITGASGSGKTITLKVMAESFSAAGVPVFLADVKGDLAGTAFPGEINEKIQSRLDSLDLKEFDAQSFPVRFWDIYGQNGHPVRANISSIGPEILSIMLGLSEAQEGNLAIAFAIAKDKNLELIDLNDLKSLLQHVSENRNEYTSKYGNITPQSIGVIQRSLLALENQGAGSFFGEPALDINDLFANAEDGRGVINILHAVELFQSPDLYASFLLWFLTELFTKSPEVGDLDKPKMVFFFDEAHLLFNGMPAYRLKRITQVVKLIRSRGIGLYFISQAPTDIPDEVIAQLGNRVQHTLRAYTPAEQKTVKAAANAFRTNPKFDTEQAIMELGTGEALISFQDAKGAPEIVEKATILPPQSQMGSIDQMSRNKIINQSPLCGKYDEALDPESAHEKISEHNRTKAEEEAAKQQEAIAAKQAEIDRKNAERAAAAEQKQKLAEERLRIMQEKEADRKKALEEKEAEKKKKNSIETKAKNAVSKGIERGFTNAISRGINKAINKGIKGLFK